MKGSAVKRPDLILTTDTELSNFPQGQGLWGRLGSEAWGLERLLDEFEALSARGTFFLDVYGQREEDVAQQRRAAEMIIARGHDLQLHTHPGPAFDPARPMLRDYSLNEQTQIIEFGCARIASWTGHRPTLHRAGDWGASNDSLKAMSSAGILADFSASPWSPNCAIEDKSVQCNGWARIDGLLSGLGTCFHDRLSGRVRRVDLGGTSFREVLDILSRRIDPFILTLHSFSLMRFGRDRRSFVGDSKYVRDLHEMCAIAVQEHGYQIRTAAQAVADVLARGESGLIAEPLPTASASASAAGILKSIRGRLASYAS